MTDIIKWATENQTTVLALVGVLAYLLFPKYRPILVSLGLIKVDTDGKPLPIELEDDGLVESVKAVKVVEKQLEKQGNTEGAEAARKAGAELFSVPKTEAK